MDALAADAYLSGDHGQTLILVGIQVEALPLLIREQLAVVVVKKGHVDRIFHGASSSAKVSPLTAHLLYQTFDWLSSNLFYRGCHLHYNELVLT